MTNLCLKLNFASTGGLVVIVVTISGKAWLWFLEDRFNAYKKLTCDPKYNHTE